MKFYGIVDTRDNRKEHYYEELFLTREEAQKELNKVVNKLSELYLTDVNWLKIVEVEIDAESTLE